jgi:hypothetical protein
VQFVFAGKAHPADEQRQGPDPQISASPPTLEVRHRFVFLEDYDIAIARALYQGCDVWLNNPRRPQEACGTSGMKAALNGDAELLDPRRLVGRGRMLRDYVDGHERAKAVGGTSLAAVSCTATAYEEVPDADGTTYLITAQVSLGELEPSDVQVQLISGEVDLDNDLRDPTTVAMTEDGDGDHPGWRRYRHEVRFARAGNFGFTVRIVPHHEDLSDYAALGRVAWAPAG